MKKHIPNLITSLNLLCGCVGIILVFSKDPIWGSYMIYIAAVFDFMDGFSARLLKAYSPMGKELDSLADVVSFGVLTGLIMFTLIKSPNQSLPIEYVALVIPVFAALRLAKFNVDEDQTDDFSGLPTPAAALTVSSFPFLMNSSALSTYFTPEILTAISLIIAVLMVAPLRLISLKFKDLKWENNKYRFIFAIGSIFLLIIWNIYSFPLIILFYILISIFSSRER